MSSIFGIVNGDEKADDNFLEAMYAPLKDFPHHKFDKKLVQEAAFGKMLNYGTPEDVYDAQPIYLSEPNIIFTAEGRIDNREELAKNLGLSMNDMRSDTFFMLQAYLKYGEETQHKLKGDWSFAAYHFNTKELFLARDTMGYTALYFYKTDRYFAFSSSIKSILALPDFKRELNEPFFVSNLTLWKVGEKMMSDETFFKNVFVLKGGYVLKIKDNEIKTTKYWPPENIKETYYKNKEDYTDQMSELLYKSVNARLRSYKPVASMLSGGLDSSTVSYIAAELLKQQNKRLTTFSHVPLFKNELANNALKNSRVLDETPFMEAIVNASGNIEPFYLDSKDISPWQGSIQCADVINGFIHGASNTYWLTDIFKNAAQKGYGTLLSGEGGNGSTSFAGVDYLLPHSLKRFIKYPSAYIRRQVLKPMYVRFLKDYHDERSLKTYVSNSYLNTELFKKYSILEDVQKKHSGFLRQFSHISENKNLFISLYHMRSSLGAAFGAHYGIEMRDPICDVDLLNYFLTIPNAVFFDDGFNNRMLVKRMMKNKLPDKVLFEKKKGLQSSDIFFRVEAAKEELFDEAATLANINWLKAYIDIDKIEKNLNTYFNGEKRQIEMQSLIKTMQASAFLRKNF